MHELSIVEALIEETQRELRRVGRRGRVVRLELAIGQLSGVNSESIRFAFELLTPGTFLEEAEVHIREPKAQCQCLDCELQVEVDHWMVRCPQCGSTEITLVGGQELMLESIEVEEDSCLQDE